MSCNQTKCVFFEPGCYYGDPAGCYPDGCDGCAEVCPLNVGWNEENTRSLEPKYRCDCKNCPLDPKDGDCSYTCGNLPSKPEAYNEETWDIEFRKEKRISVPVPDDDIPF